MDGSIERGLWPVKQHPNDQERERNNEITYSPACGVSALLQPAIGNRKA
jgi:hypothetical protein